MSLDLDALGVRNVGPAASRTASQSLGQEEFLTLLVTQLKNQDPLSPMDNEAFVAQLAQFATVSGITEMNGSLKRLDERAAVPDRLAAARWLGTRVTAADGREGIVTAVRFAEDGTPRLALATGEMLAPADVTALAPGATP